jgi:16S rRNA G966 N2-methylase RsmD
MLGHEIVFKYYCIKHNMHIQSTLDKSPVRMTFGAEPLNMVKNNTMSIFINMQETDPVKLVYQDIKNIEFTATDDEKELCDSALKVLDDKNLPTKDRSKIVSDMKETLIDNLGNIKKFPHMFTLRQVVQTIQNILELDNQLNQSLVTTQDHKPSTTLSNDGSMERPTLDLKQSLREMIDFWNKYMSGPNSHVDTALKNNFRQSEIYEHSMQTWKCLMKRDDIDKMQGCSTEAHNMNSLHGWDDTPYMSKGDDYHPNRQHQTSKGTSKRNLYTPTPDKKLTQLKLLTSMAHAVAMFVDNEYKHHLKLDESWTMLKQLRNTVVLYVGSHNSSTNMSRTHIIGLFEMFPEIRIVCMDLDAFTPKMDKVLKASGIDEKRFRIVRGKMTVQKARRIQQMLEEDGHRLCVISDIRSDLDITTLDTHKRFLMQLIGSFQTINDHTEHVIHTQLEKTLYYMGQIEKTVIQDRHFQFKLALTMKNATFSSWKTRLVYGDDQMRLWLGKNWKVLFDEENKTQLRMSLLFGSAFGRENSTELRGVMCIDYDEIARQAEKLKKNNGQPHATKSADNVWIGRINDKPALWSPEHFETLKRLTESTHAENNNTGGKRSDYGKRPDNYTIKHDGTNFVERIDQVFYRSYHVKDASKEFLERENKLDSSSQEIDIKLSRFNQTKRNIPFDAMNTKHQQMRGIVSKNIADLRSKIENRQQLNEIKQMKQKQDEIEQMKQELTEMETMYRNIKHTTQTQTWGWASLQCHMESRKRKKEKDVEGLCDKVLFAAITDVVGGWKEDRDMTIEDVREIISHCKVKYKNDMNLILKENEIYHGYSLILRPDVPIRDKTMDINKIMSLSAKTVFDAQLTVDNIINFLWNASRRMVFINSNPKSWKYSSRIADGSDIKHAFMYFDFMLALGITLQWLVSEWHRIPFEKIQAWSTQHGESHLTSQPSTHLRSLNSDDDKTKKIRTVLVSEICRSLRAKCLKSIKTNILNPSVDAAVRLKSHGWAMLQYNMILRVLSALTHSYYMKLQMPLHIHLENVIAGPTPIKTTYDAESAFNNYLHFITQLKDEWKDTSSVTYVDSVIKDHTVEKYTFKDTSWQPLTVDAMYRTMDQSPVWANHPVINMRPACRRSIFESVAFLNDYYEKHLCSLRVNMSWQEYKACYGYLLEPTKPHIFRARGENGKHLDVFTYPRNKPFIWILIRNGLNFIVNGFIESLYEDTNKTYTEIEAHKLLMYQNHNGITCLNQAVWWGQYKILELLLNRCPYWNIGHKAVRWSAQFASQTWTLMEDVAYRLKMINDAMNGKFQCHDCCEAMKDKLQTFQTELINKYRENSDNDDYNGVYEACPEPHREMVILLLKKNFETISELLQQYLDDGSRDNMRELWSQVNQTAGENSIMDVNQVMNNMPNDATMKTATQYKMLRYKFGGSNLHVIPVTEPNFMEIADKDWDAITYMTDGRTAANLCSGIYERWKKIMEVNKETRPIDDNGDNVIDHRPSIIDACAGLGGNTVPFMVCNYFKKVYAYERDVKRFKFLEWYMQYSEMNCMPHYDLTRKFVWDRRPRDDQQKYTGFSRAEIGKNRYSVEYKDFVGVMKKNEFNFEKSHYDIVFIDPPWQLNDKEDKYTGKERVQLHLYDGTTRGTSSQFNVSYDKAPPGYKLRETLEMCFGKLNACMVVIKVPYNFDTKSVHDTDTKGYQPYGEIDADENHKIRFLLYVHEKFK